MLPNQLSYPSKRRDFSSTCNCFKCLKIFFLIVRSVQMQFLAPLAKPDSRSWQHWLHAGGDWHPKNLLTAEVRVDPCADMTLLLSGTGSISPGFIKKYIDCSELHVPPWEGHHPLFGFCLHAPGDPGLQVSHPMSGMEPSRFPVDPSMLPSS